MVAHDHEVDQADELGQLDEHPAVVGVQARPLKRWTSSRVGDVGADAAVVSAHPLVEDGDVLVGQRRDRHAQQARGAGVAGEGSRVEEAKCGLGPELRRHPDAGVEQDTAEDRAEPRPAQLLGGESGRERVGPAERPAGVQLRLGHPARLLPIASGVCTVIPKRTPGPGASTCVRLVAPDRRDRGHKSYTCSGQSCWASHSLRRIAYSYESVHRPFDQKSASRCTSRRMPSRSHIAAERSFSASRLATTRRTP